MTIKAIMNFHFKNKYIFLIFDSIILLFSILLSFWLRLGKINTQWFLECLWMIPTTVIVCSITYLLTGQYKGITKYIGSKHAATKENRKLIIQNGTLPLASKLTSICFEYFWGKFWKFWKFRKFSKFSKFSKIFIFF